MITTIVADDHQIVIEGLRALLAKQMDISCVGEAQDGRQALDLVRELRPDIAIMDVGMPGLNGIDATRHIIDEFPQTRVMLLSMHAGRDYVSEALAAGATGYVVKDTAFEDLVRAIRIVAEGGVFLSQSVVHGVLDDYRNRMSGEVSAPGPDALSPREREVLQLVAEGRSAKETAAILHLSAKTVDGYRRQIMDKLGIYSIAGLVKYAIREGLTSAEG
jgi:DNA-binding NarL/FixJ family response regulator